MNENFKKGVSFGCAVLLASQVYVASSKHKNKIPENDFSEKAVDQSYVATGSTVYLTISPADLATDFAGIHVFKHPTPIEDSSCFRSGTSSLIM